MQLVFYVVHGVLHFAFTTGLGHGDLMTLLTEKQQDWLR